MESKRRKLVDVSERTWLPDNLKDRSIEGEMIRCGQRCNSTRCQDEQPLTARDGLCVSCDRETTEEPVNDRFDGGKAKDKKPVDKLEVNVRPERKEQWQKYQAACLPRSACRHKDIELNNKE
jgi:hypothetical protein